MPRVSKAMCGTDAGYQRHRKLGETPCDPCDEAHKDTMRRNRGQPKPKYCPCGRRIVARSAEFDSCWTCRERPKKAKKEATAVTVTKPAEILWERDRMGVMRAVAVYEPGELSTWSPRAVYFPAKRWEQMRRGAA